MYSIVLMTALTVGGESPSFHKFRGYSCGGCICNGYCGGCFCNGYCGGCNCFGYCNGYCGGCTCFGYGNGGYSNGYSTSYYNGYSNGYSSSYYNGYSNGYGGGCTCFGCCNGCISYGGYSSAPAYYSSAPSYSNGYSNGYTNGYSNGYSNGYPSYQSAPRYAPVQPAYQPNHAPAQPNYVPPPPDSFPAPTMNPVTSSRTGAVKVHIAEGSRLFVNGVPITMSSTVQTFPTPTLEPNRDYHYSIRATATRQGQDVFATRMVTVRAGSTVSVDLRDMQAWTAPRPEDGTGVANVSVKLPADARLYVNDSLCPYTGAERKFSSPPLVKGKDYHYTLRAEMSLDGRPVVETRKVTIAAGKAVQVDFGNFFSAATSR